MVDEYAGSSVEAERPTTASYLAEPIMPRKADAKLILSIASKVDDLVSANGWSWCDMDRVYKVLKVIHG